MSKLGKVLDYAAARAQEAVWKLSPVPRPEPSWQLDPRLLARTRVECPKTFAWPPAWHWMNPLESGFTRYVPLRRIPKEKPEPGKHVVHWQLFFDEKPHDIYLDYGDSSELDEELARRAFLYFKMQHRREGYPIDTVRPGGYFTFRPEVYSYLPAVRKLGEKKFDVYGRFGLSFEIRKKGVELLQSQRLFQFEGSLKINRFSRHLKEITQSKVCIDFPGQGDFCFRLVDYLAVGACVVAVSPVNRLPVELVDREHVVYVKRDLSDLVEVCDYYVRHDAEREKLATASREYFDRYLHKDQLAAYYLHCFFAKLSS